MTSFFPDLNVWIALTVEPHVHHREAWDWRRLLTRGDRLVFSRYTQLGLLRLLTNERTMGDLVLTTGEAWNAYDAWLNDPDVEFYPEPRSVEEALRNATASFTSQPASKWIGDCYLLAFAGETDTVLVTFDRALWQLAKRDGYSAVMPA